MEHASRLDLTSFEDPLFYDKMERARVQGTDRIVMIQSTGQLIQQFVTTISLAGGIIFLSPWILAVLIVCVIPGVSGRNPLCVHGLFAEFQADARKARNGLPANRRWQQGKRERTEAFWSGLVSGGSLHETLERTARAKRRHWPSAGCGLARPFTLLGALGYYGSYAFVIYKTVTGKLDIGTFTFMTGAIALASSNIQAVFTTFSTIADQAMFITDLLDFFNLQPRVFSKPNALPAPRPIRTGL